MIQNLKMWIPDNVWQPLYYNVQLSRQFFFAIMSAIVMLVCVSSPGLFRALCTWVGLVVGCCFVSLETVRALQTTGQTTGQGPKKADLKVFFDKTASTVCEQAKVLGHCKVCNERAATHVFSRCGHRAVCEECGPSLLSCCPLCRQKGPLIPVI